MGWFCLLVPAQGEGERTAYQNNWTSWTNSGSFQEEVKPSVDYLPIHVWCTLKTFISTKRKFVHKNVHNESTGVFLVSKFRVE